MISSEAHDLATALAKSLGLDDQSSAQPCPTYEYEPIDGPNDKELAHLKVRVQLHDHKEFHLLAAEPAIDVATRPAVHEVDHGSDCKRAVGWRLVRTVAFGVLTSVMVGVAFAWQFYGHVHGTQLVDALSSGSKVIPVRVPSEASGRVPTQDQAAVPVLAPGQTLDPVPMQDAAPVLPAQVTAVGQVSVGSESPPELQRQLETMAGDIAVVRHIVERLAVVQEQMAVDIAMLQKSGQKASLPPRSPAVPAPSRKYAPNIGRSDAVTHSPTAPAPTPLALH
jgi:hypothetical protein